MYQKNKQNFHLTKRTRRKKQAWGSFSDSIIRKKLTHSATENKKLSKNSRLSGLFNLLKFYVSRSTIHGMRYILDPELNLIEKMIWLVFVIISICLTVNVFVIIVTDFQAAPTEVVIESTSHRVSFLPFPSVTICPMHRVDWKKAMNLEKKISNDSKVIERYRKIVATLSKMSFGRFNKLGFLNLTHHEDLSHLNLTDIMFKLMPDCKDLFVKCQWRNIFQNCCDMFQIQRTEHGMCYSFNSLISEDPPSNETNVKKVTAYGSRSGLQVKLEMGNVAAPPNKYRAKISDIELGILISLNDPLVWPKVVNKVKAGSITNINVKCISGYASEEVLNLSPGKIPCRKKDLWRNVRYSQETCISECRRQHVIKNCHCNPSFYFASVNVTSCSVKDLMCLFEKREKFVNYQNPGDDNFKKDAEDVMTCDCPPACDYYNYEEKLLTVPVTDNNNISLDIHYEGPTSIRYRMNVVTSGLKLLVNFGGVFGLFVGGSIISLIEPIYIFLSGAFCRLQSYVKSKTKTDEESNPDSVPLKIYLSDFPQMKPIFTPEFYMSKERF